MNIPDIKVLISERQILRLPATRSSPEFTRLYITLVQKYEDPAKRIKFTVPGERRCEKA
jgi:hypothetical protein